MKKTTRVIIPFWLNIHPSIILPVYHSLLPLFYGYIRPLFTLFLWTILLTASPDNPPAGGAAEIRRAEWSLAVLPLPLRLLLPISRRVPPDKNRRYFLSLLVLNHFDINERNTKLLWVLLYICKNPHDIFFPCEKREMTWIIHRGKICSTLNVLIWWSSCWTSSTCSSSWPLRVLSVSSSSSFSAVSSSSSSPSSRMSSHFCSGCRDGCQCSCGM